MYLPWGVWGRGVYRFFQINLPFSSWLFLALLMFPLTSGRASRLCDSRLSSSAEHPPPWPGHPSIYYLRHLLSVPLILSPRQTANTKLTMSIFALPRLLIPCACREDTGSSLLMLLKSKAQRFSGRFPLLQNSPLSLVEICLLVVSGLSASFCHLEPLTKFYFYFMRQPFKHLRRAAVVLSINLFSRINVLNAFTLYHLPRPGDTAPLHSGSLVRLDPSCQLLANSLETPSSFFVADPTVPPGDPPPSTRVWAPARSYAASKHYFF